MRRLLSYNIRYGGLGRERELAAVIRGCDPDLVVLQEATDRTAVERIADGAGLQAWDARPGYSLAFLSREPPARYEWHWLRAARHACLELDAGPEAPVVVGVHLRAIHASWTERRRLRDVEALLELLARIDPRPHCVVGDFNSVAPGQVLELRSLPPRLRPFIWLSGGRVEWQAIARMLDAGYADAFRRLHPDDPGMTFPTTAPHVRLDYAFVPEAHAAGVTGCRVVRDPPASLASDHYPLLVDVR